MCVCTYHVRNNYVTYIVAMRPLVGFGDFAAAMSNLAQLRLRDGYRNVDTTTRG